jgi:hypothetical protein
MICVLCPCELAPRDCVAEVDLPDGTHLVFSDLPEVLAVQTIASAHQTVVAFLAMDAWALPETAAVTVVRADFPKGAAA